MNSAFNEAVSDLAAHSSGFWLKMSLRLLRCLAAVLVSIPLPLSASFVYEAPTEFFTSGDFNGDGIADVLVLDKNTGNARVGYQSSAGALTWSAPLVSGVENVTGCAVGRFLQSDRDALGVTSPEHNRVHLLNLSNTNSAGSPAILTPAGIGPNLLIALATPYGTNANLDRLLIATAYNNPTPGATVLELFATAGIATREFQNHIAGQDYLASGNALRFGAHPATFAAGISHGSGDHFVSYSFTNGLNLVLQLSNLLPASEYVFGQFNNEVLPRFLFYVPGESNVTIHPVIATGSGFAFGAAITVTLNQAIERVYYVVQGTAGSAIIQFGNGIQGMTLPGGTPSFAPLYQSGLGAAGNTFTGVAPLGNGRFALLDAPTGAAGATHAQVIHFDGATYTQLSSSHLSPLSTHATRANVWLFQTEPFVVTSATFIGSLNTPDWSSGVFGLPNFFSVQVRVETDGGSASGLGSPATNNFSVPPSGVSFGLPNQYRDDISLFSYSAPRSDQLVITIAPPPGTYGGPISISFTRSVAADIFYRLGAADTWRTYLVPFSLTNDATIQYYGVSANGGARARLQFATYSLGQSKATPPPPLAIPGGNTNPPPVLDTNRLVMSSYGTVIYGRRTFPDPNGTIWAINLDGSGDRYVTIGARPRVSSDGRYLAFLREGEPFNDRGNLWIRDLVTGQETRLFSNSEQLVCYDWEYGKTNLFFDYSCNFWRIGLDGVATQLPLSIDCFADAPAYDPVSGRLAFHILNSTLANPGLYVTSADYTTAQRLNVIAPNPRWPAWSPDGRHLAFVDSDSRFSLDSGKNLWVVKPDGTGLHPITGLMGLDGFRHGAIWAPAGDALIGAGIIFSSSGIWIIPLSEDRSMCAGEPRRLPTVPGDPINFVGGIHLPPPPPQLFVRRESSGVIVYWRRTVIPYVLEYAQEPNQTSNWSAVSGSFQAIGEFSEYFVPNGVLAQAQFFRLRVP